MNNKKDSYLTLYTCPYVPLPTTSTSSKIPAGSYGRHGQIHKSYNMQTKHTLHTVLSALVHHISSTPISIKSPAILFVIWEQIKTLSAHHIYFCAKLCSSLNPTHLHFNADPMWRSYFM